MALARHVNTTFALLLAHVATSARANSSIEPERRTTSDGGASMKMVGR